MNKHQLLAINALKNMISGDTVRMRAAFQHLTPAQMQEQYGDSGQTRAQLLSAHEEHDAKIHAAINWIQSQNPKKIRYTKVSKFGTCKVCGCTDDDCSQCIARTGIACYWVDSKHTICSACV